MIETLPRTEKEKEIEAVFLRANYLDLNRQLDDTGTTIDLPFAPRLKEADLTDFSETVLLEDFDVSYTNYISFLETINDVTKARTHDSKSRNEMMREFNEWFDLSVAQTFVDSNFIFNYAQRNKNNNSEYVLNISPAVVLSVDQIQEISTQLFGFEIMDEATLAILGLYSNHDLSRQRAKSTQNTVHFSLIPTINSLSQGLPRIGQVDLLDTLNKNYPHLGTLSLLEAIQHAKVLKDNPLSSADLNFRFFELAPKKPKYFVGNLDTSDINNANLVSLVPGPKSLRMHTNEDRNPIIDYSSPKEEEGTLIIIS